MKKIIEKIDITPHKSLYIKLGQAGYSISEAIAELVDNSIDARFNFKSVNINIDIDKEKNKLVIEDDARGMDKKTAQGSIVLGLSKKSNGQLGQFGLGLKTAASSLGGKFRITTTKRGDDEEYEIEFDEKKFITEGDWKDFEMIVKKGTNKGKSGTRIAIEDLKFKVYPSLVGNIKKQLAERFAPFIKNKEAIIKVNGAELESESPALIKNSAKDVEISLASGEKIKGWIGILQKGSQEKSGFNLFRNNRLIRAYEKLGYLYHPSKMWIVGEIFLDCMPVTHNKREFITEHPLYLEFLEKFSKVLEPFLEEAKKRNREKIINDLPEEVKETLKDNLMKAVNRVNDFQGMAFPSADTEGRSGGESDSAADFGNGQKIPGAEKNKRATSFIHGRKGRKNNAGNSHRPEISKKFVLAKPRLITIEGRKFEFNYRWEELEEEIPKVVDVDYLRGTVIVTLNQNFPLLNIIKKRDLEWYITFYVVEGIAEAFLKEGNGGNDKIIPLRDKTIKELASIVGEDAKKNIE